MVIRTGSLLFNFGYLTRIWAPFAPRDARSIKCANRGFAFGERSAFVAIKRCQFLNTVFYYGRELLLVLKRFQLDLTFDVAELSRDPTKRDRLVWR